jgi:outer membrane protein W
MKKYFLIISIIISLSATAQDKGSQLYLNGGGGLQGFGYSLSEGRRSNGFGYNVELGYRYFFNDRWGVGIGAAISSYSSEGTLNGATYSYPATDTDGEAYTVNVAVSRLKEKQAATFFEIPITARYRLPLGDKFEFWAGAGVKLGFATTAEYELEEGNITTMGYYAQYQWTVKDRPEHGFSTYNLAGQSADLKLKTSVSGLLEAGIGYKLTDRLSLNFGLYGAYCFTDVNEELQNTSGIISTTGEVNTYNGLLASSLTGSVRPFAVRAKVGVSFTF